jgi:flagellar hook-associated protein 1 FlgK
MLGLFGTLNLASRSLQTQMTGVEVTGQNIANASTTGYSRQRVDITSSPDLTTSAGQEGTGADVTGIQQVVNSLLNNQIQSQGSTSGYWSAQQTALQSVEDGLDEYLNGSGSSSSTSSTSSSTSSTTDTGISSQLSAFFTDLQSVATSPTSVSARQTLIGDAQTLAASFNTINTKLNSTTDSLNASVSTGVASANKLLTDIASLNSEISSAEASGGNANDLTDAREQDLENLSQLTNITTGTDTNGSVNVTIGGQTLVSGNTVNDTLQTYDSGNGNLLVRTATGQTSLTLSGGSIQGTIDARDGTLATLKGSLNSLAGTLITQVNAVHSGGYSLTGTTGSNFFTGSDASTITVNPALVSDPTLIQASGSATAASDNSVALQMADLASTAQSTLNNQTFSDNYNSSVASFGTALGDANTQVTDQTKVATMLNTQRSSTSGVNIDEEMTNMLAYQRAYEASAQLVTTVNTMMGDTLSMKTA